MESDIKDNVVLIDWLTCSFAPSDTQDWQFWADVLGLSDVSWVPMEHGRNGYRAGMYFEGISILYDARDDMGVCVNMSGQGCRSFESFGRGDWLELFDFLQEDGFHISRLDVAFDDHTGILDLNQMFFDTDDRNFVSKSRFDEITKSFKDGRPGITIYHGSPRSDIRFRIYDKAAERNCDVDQHWVRVEMQLRNDRASAFAFSAVPLGERFRGVLCNYLRYVDFSSSDSNRWRWPMKDYWARLIDGIAAIQLYTAPGTEYNIDKLDHYVFGQAGQAISAAVAVYGADEFVRRVQAGYPVDDLSVKYRSVIQDGRRRERAFAVHCAAVDQRIRDARAAIREMQQRRLNLLSEGGGTDTPGARSTK